MQRIFHTLILSVFALTLHAQGTHEVSGYLGAGASSISYRPNVGNRGTGFGVRLGGSYRYAFMWNWGFSVGLEAAYYKSSVNINTLSTYSRAINYDPTQDIPNGEFDFYSRIDAYEEAQHAIFVQVPLMLDYTFGTTVPLYAAAGLKFGFPAMGTFSNSASRIANRGYFELENKSFPEELHPEDPTWKHQGFGIFDDGRKNDGDLDFNMAVIGSVETGVKFLEMGSQGNLTFYLGIYADFGLNNVMSKMQKEEKPICEYNTDKPRDFKLNSVLNATYSSGNSSSDVTSSFAGAVRPIQFGVRFRVSFGL